ncbi:MAG: polysaccharide deacetylase family protein [Crocosphaera sp.]
MIISKFWLITFSSIIIFLLSLTIFFYQPRWFLKIIMQVAPGVHYFAETPDKIVAITIDDGPNAITTPKILETLSQNNATATFFLISERIENNESLVTNMINNGHKIGHHMVKDEKSIFLSREAFEQEFLIAERTLHQFLNPVVWFRPGGGWYNSQMLDIVKKYNYHTALGSIFPYDTHIASSEFASYHILSNLRPGAIIILHDSGRDGTSGDWGERTNITLKKILPEIKNRGYRTVTLSEMFLGD